MNSAVIVYGPQGCGKTRNAQALMREFGKTKLYDDDLDLSERFRGNKPLLGNLLVLTNDEERAKKHAENFGSKAVAFNATKVSCNP